MKKLLSGNEEIFNFFTGKWKIERKIGDCNKDKNLSKIEGIVTFSKRSGHHALYREEVQISFTTGLTTIGMQTYLFELSESHISQYRFDPGNNVQGKNPFSSEHPGTVKMYDLEFVPSAGIILATGSHVCLLDQYDVTYAIYSQDMYSTTYNIEGPDKYSNIYTKYTRIHEIS